MNTRRQALAAAAGITAAALSPGSASAATGGDRAPLAALLAYQQQVVLGYQVALARAPLSQTERATLTGFGRQAAQAAAALAAALKSEGGTPGPAPDRATAPQPADATPRGFAQNLIAAEEAAVAGFYDGMQALQDERHLSGTAALMAQAGRRLVVLRELAGAPLLPRNFETGGA